MAAVAEASSCAGSTTGCRSSPSWSTSCNEYPTPRNLNYWWNFGSLAGIMLVIMIVTGIFLAMQYTPHIDLRLRFGRAHHARRELRLADALHPHERRVVLLHRRLHPHLPRPLLRLLQGAARAPVDAGRRHPAADDGDRLHGLRAALGADELLGRHRHHQSVLGHSRWSATTSSPGCGAASRSTTRPSTASSRSTTCCPSSSSAWWCCIWSRCTSTARTIRSGIDRKGPQDTHPLPPLLHDQGHVRPGRVPDRLRRRSCSISPNLLGDPDNYIPANPLQTPAEIVPEWYFLPFYAILRSIPDKLAAASCAMFGSILVLFVLPWLDTSPVRSAYFRPIYQMGLLAPGDRLLRARAGSARIGRKGWYRRHRPDRHPLLLPPFPGPAAAPRLVRAAAAAADQHQRRGPEEGGGAWPLHRQRGVSHDAALCRTRSPARRCSRWLGARLGRRKPPNRRCPSWPGPSPAPSAPSTGPPCSAASRSTTRSARPAIRMNLLHYRDLEGLGYQRGRDQGDRGAASR